MIEPYAQNIRQLAGRHDEVGGAVRLDYFGREYGGIRSEIARMSGADAPGRDKDEKAAHIKLRNGALPTAETRHGLWLRLRCLLNMMRASGVAQQAVSGDVSVLRQPGRCGRGRA